MRDGVLVVQVIQPAVRYELDRSWKRSILRKLQAVSKRLCAKCASARNLHALGRLFFMDVIIIKGLEVNACVGVSDEERRNSQRLQIDAILTH
jgi:hypothetical protein